jgi:plasmid maintenance system antidote protein VapI
MEDSPEQNPVATLKAELGLTFEEFGEKLGCKKGHAFDLCSGRRTVTQPIAVKLEALSGKPWHEWMPQLGEAAA